MFEVPRPVAKYVAATSEGEDDGSWGHRRKKRYGIVNGWRFGERFGDICIDVRNYFTIRADHTKRNPRGVDRNTNRG
jgi:hypothetical protein